MDCLEVCGHGAANICVGTHRSDIEFAAAECIELAGNAIRGREYGCSRCLFDYREFELSDRRLAKNDVKLISATQEFDDGRMNVQAGAVCGPGRRASVGESAKDALLVLKGYAGGIGSIHLRR